MLKKLFGASALVLALGLVGCGDEPENPKEDKENDVAKEDELTYPTIEGTQAYDVVLSIEDATGIPKPETVHNEDTYSWSGTDALYSYEIESNKNHEIGHAEFYALEGDVEYLGFCATMPSKNIDSDKAKTWVEENAGTEATAEFGDAVFKLSVGEGNTLILTIESKGYQNWVDAWLDAHM